MSLSAAETTELARLERDGTWSKAEKSWLIALARRLNTEHTLDETAIALRAEVNRLVTQVDRLAGVEVPLISVTPAPGAALPPAGGGGSDADVYEDFSSYSSVANLLTDPRGIYMFHSEVSNTSQISLGTGGPNGTAKYLRYTFPDRTSEGQTTGLDGYCTSYNVNIMPMRVPDFGAEYSKQVALQWYGRFSSDFSISDGDGCISAADYKYLFLLPRNASGSITTRFHLDTGQGLWNYGTPIGTQNGDATSPTFGDVVDAAWHKYQIAASVGDPGNEFYRVIIDDVLKYDLTGQTFNQANMACFRFGANMNRGPTGHTQTLDWGDIKLYKEGNLPSWATA